MHRDPPLPANALVFFFSGERFAFLAFEVDAGILFLFFDFDDLT
jgi:hypothetical protein